MSCPNATDIGFQVENDTQYGLFSLPRQERRPAGLTITEGQGPTTANWQCTINNKKKNTTHLEGLSM